MIWDLIWHHAAHWGLLNNVGPSAAARIDKALMDFAAKGSGSIEQLDIDDPNRFRLRVEGAEARIFIDRRARTILVTSIHRRR